MKETCSTCRHCHTLYRWDFDKMSKGEKKWKQKVDGIACLLYTHENTVINVVGVSIEHENCEGWMPRKEDVL